MERGATMAERTVRASAARSPARLRARELGAIRRIGKRGIAPEPEVRVADLGAAAVEGDQIAELEGGRREAHVTAVAQLEGRAEGDAQLAVDSTTAEVGS